MPRSLAFGNGSVLVTLDRFARVRDFYFPYVGLENHVGGPYAHRIGVFSEGQFSWLDDGTWTIDIRSDLAYTGLSTAFSRHLGVELHFTDILYHEKNIFLRKVKVHNRSDREREVRIFFNQQFEIYHSEKGDTAFYDPATHTVIHYEGQRAFLVNASTGEHGFYDYSVGLFQLEGKEGTYKDAEDGTLSKNPIEHGRVDSTISVSLQIPKESVRSFCFWLAAGTSVDEVKELNRYVLHHTPENLINSARDYWHAWVERNEWNFYGLGENVVELFKKSQFYLRSHVDQHGGILASGDSDMLQGGRDTYAYVWPRDGAYVAVALDWLGDRHSTRKFFEFVKKALSPEGYLMHKYRADGSLGSSWEGWLVDGRPQLPIQEDETALILWALWEHWVSTRDLDFVESMYESFIKPAGQFLAAHRDPYTGLPKPSYNLWEEKFGIHTYTAATVYGGLKAAARFSTMLGKDRSENNFDRIADEMQGAIVKHLYNPEDGSFYRSLIMDPKGLTVYDRTVDASSAYGIFYFEVLPKGDERLIRAMALTKERLTVRTPVGGIARYEGDDYYRTAPGTPGNPWFITTLWQTQFAIARAANDQDLDPVRADLNWVERNALRSGILSEQLNPHTGEQVGAAPLTWSHAEYIRTVILYMRKLKELGIVK
ncbi:MAG: glycoside hydrolase family 15 protein [bacterium]|nr:glycoside hydrolase family 15 protein [bacterium]